VVAADLIGKQIREFIDNDLEYAAAKNALEKKDEQIAKFVTGEWRKEQVRKAGGSEALARQRASEDGVDFEELVRQQFRLNMTRLYYQNKIFPLIQVSAEDMRQYYDQNQRQFQKPAAAKFRAIWISTEATGGRNEALKKAQSIIEKAKAGEDFGELAAKFNDDPNLQRTHGVVGSNKGWMEKGEYAVEKVEQSAWEMKPGQVSATPIDVSNRGRDGFWVVKLEEIQPGVSEPFGSQKVQDEIRETLRRTQFARLRELHRRKLVQEAVIRENADMRDVTMEMVMQRYRVWVATR
jgi:parvulin-like peptidyl-prolyl isomerase